MENLKSRMGLNSDHLKIIALAAMIINHFCYSYCLYVSDASYFVSTAHWYLTRLSFVIYCFFIAEGMTKTHDRKKYLLRLFVFGIVSEIPFDLCFYMEPFHRGNQNVFFTLFLGAFSIYLYDHFKKSPAAGIISLSLCIMAARLISCDYTGLGVILIFAFYVFKKSRRSLLITAMAFAAAVFIHSAISYIPYVTTENYMLCLKAVLKYWGTEMHGLAAFPLLYLYNGEKGKIRHRVYFYAAYPAHLFLIFLIITALM